MRIWRIQRLLILTTLCMFVLYCILDIYMITKDNMYDLKRPNLFNETIQTKNNEQSQLTTKSRIPKKNSKNIDNSQLPWYFKDGRIRPNRAQVLHDSKLRTRQVWPNENVYSDRVDEQLMFVPPNYQYENASMKTILLYFGLDQWHILGGQNEFLRKECPVNRCSITNDVSKSSVVDAILFDTNFKYPGHSKSDKQVWILYLLESPYVLRYFNFENVFNWTATYRHDSEIVTPYERWTYYDPAVTQVEKLDQNYASNRTKRVAWFVSNCKAKNRRLQYAQELSKYISVDVYGKCGTLKCPKSDACFKMLSNNYKFYLAFENANCVDYVTEKFFINGLQQGVLPIVMGDRREVYERIAPKRSFLHVDDYESPKRLAEHLHQLDADDALYNEYFRWKGTGEFIDTRFFCRLCAMLHDDGASDRHYNDINEWWNGPSVCNRTEPWRLSP